MATNDFIKMIKMKQKIEGKKMILNNYTSLDDEKAYSSKDESVERKIPPLLTMKKREKITIIVT